MIQRQRPDYECFTNREYALTEELDRAWEAIEEIQRAVFGEKKKGKTLAEVFEEEARLKDHGEQ